MINKKIYKLLLVDDDRIIREIYEKLFSKEFEIMIAASGNEALKFLEETIFHAIVTDIQMPEMSGIELAKKIRSSNTLNGRALIIGVTATPHSIAKEAFGAGIAKLFAKPSEFPEIQTYLNHTLQKLGY